MVYLIEKVNKKSVIVKLSPGEVLTVNLEKVPEKIFAELSVYILNLPMAFQINLAREQVKKILFNYKCPST